MSPIAPPRPGRPEGSGRGLRPHPPLGRGQARGERGGTGGRRRAVAVTRSRGFTGKIAKGKPHHSIPAHYVRWLPTPTKRGAPHMAA